MTFWVNPGQNFNLTWGSTQLLHWFLREGFRSPPPSHHEWSRWCQIFQYQEHRPSLHWWGSVSSEVCLYKAGNTGGDNNTSSSSVQGTHPSLHGLAAHPHNKPDQSNYTKQLYTQIFLTTSLPWITGKQMLWLRAGLKACPSKYTDN